MLSLTLSRVENNSTYENFCMIARDFYNGESKVSMLTATTLLVPEYVEAWEVELIAKFIAEIDPSIPYNLLIFHPDFMMTDLPITPRSKSQTAITLPKDI